MEPFELEVASHEGRDAQILRTKFTDEPRIYYDIAVGGANIAVLAGHAQAAMIDQRQGPLFTLCLQGVDAEYVNYYIGNFSQEDNNDHYFMWCWQSANKAQRTLGFVFAQRKRGVVLYIDIICGKGVGGRMAQAMTQFGLDHGMTRLELHAASEAASEVYFRRWGMTLDLAELGDRIEQRARDLDQLKQTVQSPQLDSLIARLGDDARSPTFDRARWPHIATIVHQKIEDMKEAGQQTAADDLIKLTDRIADDILDPFTGDSRSLMRRFAVLAARQRGSRPPPKRSPHREREAELWHQLDLLVGEIDGVRPLIRTLVRLRRRGLDESDRAAAAWRQLMRLCKRATAHGSRRVQQLLTDTIRELRSD